MDCNEDETFRNLWKERNSLVGFPRSSRFEDVQFDIEI